MVLTAQALVEDIGTLVSLPEVVFKINKMVNDEHASAADMGWVFSQDPGLATRLLRIANSSMYGGMRQIDSVTRAVAILGTEQIRDIVISTTAAKGFEGISNDILSVADFWHHSLYCALLARALAEKSRQANPDTLFTAGLLHDIGHLIMLNRIPQEELAAIMLTAQGEASRDLIEAERELLGFDHTAVGECLVQQWHLPDVIGECIACHHHPSQASQHTTAVAHIHIANVIASLPDMDIPAAQGLNRIDPAAWAMAGLQVADIGDAIQAAQVQIGEMQKSLFGDALE